MFAIGDKEWPGVSKVLEEMGELGQVLGKLMGSRGDVKHWSGDLNLMMHEEMGDVIAAIWFMAEKCGLDQEAISRRARIKSHTFEKWHAEDPEK